MYKRQVMGVASMLVTRAVYAVEDAFERLPMHWMWWPAIGGVVVGLVGWYSPHTMGVGYDNIDRILQGDFAGSAVLVLSLIHISTTTRSTRSARPSGTPRPRTASSLPTRTSRRSSATRTPCTERGRSLCSIARSAPTSPA